MYDLEDRFIESTIVHEAEFLFTGYQAQGKWPAPRNSYMKLYFSPEQLPESVKSVLIKEPKRIEFYGEQGKHYHLLKLPELKNVYLLAEVSQQLLVRPITGILLKSLLIFCLTLMVISCLIAWLLGRKTVKPLQQLANLVDGVAPEKIPDDFADQFPNNEIGILASTIEQTMARSKQALLREKNFTRDVSHELRTPVAIIKNAVEVYQNNALASENTETLANDELMKRISDASMQMEQTVVTLLSLAREEHACVDKSSVNLLAQVEQAVIDHSYLLNNKAVEVIVDDNTNSNVYVQQGMLKILLDNLISNAFQYTNEGEINISYANHCVVIEDTGSGIEADIADSITEVAVKGSQSTGYGFGLSIVKRLCEHQGWQLSVQSNQGTKISVSFENKR